MKLIYNNVIDTVKRCQDKFGLIYQVSVSIEQESPADARVTRDARDARFSRYSPLSYTVTLKVGFGVTQGHRKWHHSIQHIRLYIRLP